MRAIALFCLTFFAQTAVADVTVFAAASLRGALDEVNAQYGDQVTVSYASSATLARQIAQGAPADLFISANPEWVDYLENDPFVNVSQQVNFLSNQLVLIGSDRAVDVSLHLLPSALHGRNFAIPLTNAVPAGIYGREALQSLGLWSAVEPHLVQTDNVRSALALAALGEVDYALVYLTDAKVEDNVRILDHVPESTHQAIRYVVGQIETHRQASEYLEFLTSKMAGKIFIEKGFLAPQGEKE